MSYILWKQRQRKKQKRKYKIIRIVTEDKTDHTDETDQQCPALIVDIQRNMTEEKSGNKEEKKTEHGNYSEDKKRGKVVRNIQTKII